MKMLNSNPNNSKRVIGRVKSYIVRAAAILVKPFKNRFNSKVSILIFIIGLVLLIFGLYLLVGPKPLQNTAKDDKPIVVGVGDVPVETFDQFGNGDGKKPSSVCATLTKEKVTEALGEPIDKVHPSVPDTKTKEGSVAACSYAVAITDDQIVRSVQITQRKLADQNKAKDAYSYLSKTDKAKQLDVAGAQAVQISNQVVVLKDGTITTITVVNQKKDIDNTNSLKTLVGLL